MLEDKEIDQKGHDNFKGAKNNGVPQLILDQAKVNSPKVKPLNSIRVSLNTTHSNSKYSNCLNTVFNNNSNDMTKSQSIERLNVNLCPDSLNSYNRTQDSNLESILSLLDNKSFEFVAYKESRWLSE